MFSKLNIAQEYVAYQFQNGLGKDIENIFQDFIDYKEDFDRKYKLMAKDYQESFKRSMALLEYFNKITLNKLTKLLKDKCNIHLNKTDLNNISTPFSPKITGLIAIIPDYENFNLNLIRELYKSGMVKFKSTTELDQLYKVLNEQIKPYNPKNGKLSIPIDAALYLEPNVLLFSEFTHTNVEPFTAKELTAITLHEIGHVYYTVFNLANITNNAYVMNDIYMQFMNMSNEDKIKFIKRNMNALQELNNKQVKEGNLVDPKYKQKVARVIDGILNAIESTPILDTITTSQSTFAIFGKIAAIVLSWLMLVRTTLTNIQAYFIYQISKMQQIGYLRKRDVALVETVTERTFKLDEINADAFVSAYGYSAYAISALDKINKIFTITAYNLFGSVVDNNTLYKDLKGFVFLVELWYSLLRYLPPVFNTYLNDEPFKYETMYERYDRLLNTMYVHLKNSNLTDFQKKQIIKEIERTKLNMSKSKEYFSNKWVKKFWDIVLGIELTKMIAGNIYDGRFTKEITNVLNKLDKLMSNSFYFHSAKIKTLL